MKIRAIGGRSNDAVLADGDDGTRLSVVTKERHVDAEETASMMARRRREWLSKTPPRVLGQWVVRMTAADRASCGSLTFLVAGFNTLNVIRSCRHWK